MVKPQASFSDEEWTKLVQNPIDDDTVDGGMIRDMAAISALVQQARRQLCDPFVAASVIKELRLQARGLQQSVNHIRHELTERVASLERQFADPRMLPSTLGIIHAHYGRSAMMSLCNCMILNLLRSALEDDCLILAGLENERPTLRNEVYDYCSKMSQYRPLGTIYMGLALRLVFCIADEQEKEFILTEIDGYQSDVLGTPFAVERWRLDQLRDYLTLRDIRAM